MTAFINKEIKNLKTLRRIAIVFLCLMNVGIMALFTYLFYDVDSEIFFLFQVMILAIFLSIIGIIYRRINFAISQLKKLNSNFSNLYQAYCNCRLRFFSEVPRYIISQNGLIIINNVELRTLKKNEYNRLVVKRTVFGRLGQKCIVKIYQNEKKITSLIYEKHYPEEVDFLINNIRTINNHISINSNK